MLLSKQVLKKRSLVAGLMPGQGRECVEMLDPPEPPCVHKILCVLPVCYVLVKIMYHMNRVGSMGYIFLVGRHILD